MKLETYNEIEDTSIFNVVTRMLEPFCKTVGIDDAKLIDVNEIPELMRIFFKIINLPKPDNFEGLDNVMDAINVEFSTSTSFASAAQCFLYFSKVEAIVKHFLYLLKPEKWESVVSENKTLAWCLTSLCLIPPYGDTDCINLQTVNPEELYVNPKARYPYLEHVVRAYKCRNSESHQCPMQTRFSLVQNEVSLWITYLYIIKMNRDACLHLLKKEQLHNFSCVGYCRDLVAEYEQANSDFKYYPFRWNNEKDHTDTVIEETMFSTSFRTLLYGEAGSGKSVALRYLTYIAAKTHIDNDNAPVPVLVEMKNLKGKSLIEQICSILSFSQEECKLLLENGHLLLFFDGLNEIVSHDPTIKTVRMRMKYIEQLKAIYNSFPKTRIWLTDRSIPNFGAGEEYTKEKFQIQKMQKADIVAFCKENLPEEYSMDEMEFVVNLRDDLVAFLNTPFKIKMFSNLIFEKKAFPSSETELIDQYLRMIIQREWEEKGTLNIESTNVFFKLLENFSMLIKKNGNDDVSFEKIFDNFASTLERFGESRAQTQSCINIAVELKILEKREGDYYNFASEQYRRYFLARYMNEKIDSM